MDNDTQNKTIKLLEEIRNKLEFLEMKQVMIENRIEKIITDLNLVYQFQRTFTERLSIVEKFCIEQPLKSTTHNENDGE